MKFGKSNNNWFGATPGNTLDGIGFFRDANGLVSMYICADNRNNVTTSRRRLKRLIKLLQEYHDTLPL